MNRQAILQKWVPIYLEILEKALIYAIFENISWDSKISLLSSLLKRLSSSFCWIGQNIYFHPNLLFFPSKICCKFVKVEVNIHIEVIKHQKYYFTECFMIRWVQNMARIKVQNIFGEGLYMLLHYNLNVPKNQLNPSSKS